MSAVTRSKKRRTEGRAEDRSTLEEQLLEGLEDTFPRERSGVSRFDHDCLQNQKAGRHR
jgi:hypothetical protein